MGRCVYLPVYSSHGSTYIDQHNLIRCEVKHRIRLYVSVFLPGFLIEDGNVPSRGSAGSSTGHGQLAPSSSTLKEDKRQKIQGL